MEICDYMMEAKPVKIANSQLLFSGHNSKLDYCNTNNFKEPFQLTLNVNNNQLMSRSLKCKMTESL